MPIEAALEELEGAMCSASVIFCFFGGRSPCIPLISGLPVSSAALYHVGEAAEGANRRGDGFLSCLLMQTFISGVQLAGLSGL